MNMMYEIVSSMFAALGAYMLATAWLDKTVIPEQGKMKPDRAAHMKSPGYRMFVRAAGVMIRMHPKKDRLAGYFERTRKRLLLAGGPLSLTPEEFLAMKELVCMAALLVSTALGFSLTLTVVLGTGGFFYPDLWLREQYTKRRTAILKELPYILDLMTLSIEAGLDLTGSVNRVVEKTKQGILRSELFQFLQELKMGKARKQALADMAARTGVPEVVSLVSAIIQSDELGTGLGRTLRIQSREFRTRRFQRAEKLAMEAPVKMTFPLLFIFTAVFFLLFGSFAVQALRGKLF